MARYHEIAKQANEEIKAAMQDVFEQFNDIDKQALARAFIRVYNLGIRTAPRPVQSTVRLNACKEAAKGLGLSVTMETVNDERTGKSYNALCVE